jgi:hypothetical protein
VEAAKEQDSRHSATMRGLLLEIEYAVARTVATCERIMAVVVDQDPRLIDPPDDEDGVFIIRSGSNPALTEKMNAIWAEDNAVAAVDKLFEQLRQLAEDHLVVAAVEKLFEQITDYDR